MRRLNSLRMVSRNYYGPNYLLDMALASRFTEASVVGKGAFFRVDGDQILLSNAPDRYSRDQRLAGRRAMALVELFDGVSLTCWAFLLGNFEYQAQGVSIDEFNYCERASGAASARIEGVVNDLRGLDEGLSLDSILDAADEIPPAMASTDQVPVIAGAELGSWLPNPKGIGPLTYEVADEVLHIESQLQDGEHTYVYAARDLSPGQLGDGRLYLDVEPGLDIRLALRFLNDGGKRLGSTVLGPNENHDVEMPADTGSIQVGLRVAGAGATTLKRLILGHRKLEPSLILARGNHLVLTNHYPTHVDLYRNAFVHRRVVGYRDLGINVDVFRLRQNQAVGFHEFEDVECITGSKESLASLLESQRYESIMVHFLGEEMWDVLRDHIGHTRVIVWVHGAEIQP